VSAATRLTLRRRRQVAAADRGGHGRDLPDVEGGKVKHENDGGGQPLTI
jgi:hypothetical protein